MNTPAATRDPPHPAPLQRTIDRLAAVAAATAIAALLGLVLVQGWQVVARYVLDRAPSWTEPVTVLLLATLVGLGAAAGVHERRHFTFTLLAEALPPTAQRVTRAATQLVIALIGGVMAVWGALLFADGLHVPAAGARLPQSAGYLPLAIGGALISVFALWHLFTARSATPGH